MTERMNENLLKALIFMVIFTVLLFHTFLSNAKSAGRDAGLALRAKVMHSGIQRAYADPRGNTNAAFRTAEKPDTARGHATRMERRRLKGRIIPYAVKSTIFRKTRIDGACSQKNFQRLIVPAGGLHVQ